VRQPAISLIGARTGSLPLASRSVSIAKATHRESMRACISLWLIGKERKEKRIKPSLKKPYSSSTGPETLMTSSESS
jgi:hypothetical protein